MIKTSYFHDETQENRIDRLEGIMIGSPVSDGPRLIDLFDRMTRLEDRVSEMDDLLTKLIRKVGPVE